VAVGALNESQARRLRVTCQYVDRLLGEIEALLNAAGSKAAFPKYIPDVSPADRRTIEDYIARVRAQLSRVLSGQGITPEPPEIPARRAVRANLTGIDIAVEELRPKYMVGFGTVDGNVAVELDGIVGEMRSLVARLDRYVAQGEGQDLRARLDRIEKAGEEVGLLTRIEEVVTRRGLVEFRAPIASLLDRMADTSLEVAVFGRVSSGKSSLLNVILGTDALPVGVTPVTSIPTRLGHGESPGVTVCFAERPAQECEITRLAEFVTEQENPGNLKNVTRVTVRIPSPRLAEGVVFVDTPGLGSLATTGAAETLAYLPKCDLGVVLIDAGSPLTAGDLQTIQALAEAAIPASVLLSKVDLLSPGDLERVTRYVGEQLVAEGRPDLAIHPVSVLPSHRDSLDRWFSEAIAPLYAKSRELRAASLRRKTGALRESVAAVLEARLRRADGASTIQTEPAPAGGLPQIHAVESRLRVATGRIAEMRAVCEGECQRILAEREIAFRAAAASVLESPSAAERGADETGEPAREGLVAFIQQRVHALHERLLGFAREMAAELQAAALAVGLPDAPEASEFEAPLRGSPAFEFAKFEFRASRSPLAGLGGQSAVERRLARRLERAVGEDWTRSLVTYVSLLNHWCAGVVKQWHARFEGYAEGYRAQAERALARSAPTEEDARELSADLATLGGTNAAAAAAAERRRGIE
jgi:GTP-binding protein EngB required for normal cell division